MEIDLNKIAQELYGKLESRFKDITFADEHAEILSKKVDVPKARFFEFEYKNSGVPLGTISITLDEDDGIVVELSGKLAESNHPSVLKFLKGLRKFAKSRLLNFDEKNTGKDNLDKRDYFFRAKPKETPMMEPIMENKLFGTSRMSYQDLGEATLIIKHSQPVNTELAAGRTMHIENIYIENAQGERFRYPTKHINGARALAEHIKAGGNPYDSIGKHITGLSEELAQLRKFKGYVGRNEALSEAMGDITSKVMERIEQVKKEVSMLQRPAYYAEFAESFTDYEEQMIPEDIMSDWIDRLTIRTFNEDLRTAFPYIFRLVDETSIPVKGLNPDDLFAEASDTVEKDEKGNVKSWKHEGDWKKVDPKKNPEGKVHNLAGRALKKTKELNPAESFESFMEKILPEDIEAQTGKNNLFSPNLEIRGEAIKSLKQAMEAPLPVGESGLTAIQSLEGIIDSQALTAELQKLASDGDDQIDSRGTIKTYLINVANGSIEEPEAPDAKEVAEQLIAMDEIPFSGGDDEIGGQNMDQPPAEAEPLAPAPAPAAAPPAAAPAPAEPAAAPAPEEVPPAAPVAEATISEVSPHDYDSDEDYYNARSAKPKHRPQNDYPYSREEDDDYFREIFRKKREAAAKAKEHGTSEGLEGLKSKFKKAVECGATGSTKMNFTGRGETTLLSAMESLGIDPREVGIEIEQDPVDSILKSIIGFWNPEEKNFTIGGTKAKIKIFKDFKNGEYPGCRPEHVKHVIDMIEKMDPSSDVHGQEQAHVLKLAGVGGHEHSIAEGPSEDFAKMMQDFTAKNPQFDVNAAVKQMQQKQPANAQGMPQFNLDDPEGMQNHFKNFASQIAPQLGQKVQAATAGQPTQDINMPGFNGKFNPADLGNHINNMMKGMNFNEAAELDTMLKIAGIRK
jgi:hypothetical protein